MEKKEIRKVMKGRRAKLSRDQVLEYSSVIWGKIYKIPNFECASTILLYSSFGNEVDTVEIATKALSLGKRIAYPVTNMVDMTMTFHTVEDLRDLKLMTSGSFKLNEPKPDPATLIVPDGDTLIIVPGLAFDEDGYRTGYGGGFYDKYIGKHPVMMTVGVCYDFQVITTIPRDAYDQPVKLLVTETNKA